MNTDRIEKSVVLKAPISRVWRALTDHEQFGAWFKVRIDQPFAEGQESTGKMTYPGYEHCAWQAKGGKVQPEHYFAFRWPQIESETPVDMSTFPTTLVEFGLQNTAEGTRLTVTESGFGNVPEAQRMERLRLNTEGWTTQMKNIADYVAQTPVAAG